MPQLPRERQDELLKLYGAMRNCALDEIGSRLNAFRNACVKAADDYSAGAISGEEIGDSIADQWHAQNRLKPGNVKN